MFFNPIFVRHGEFTSLRLEPKPQWESCNAGTLLATVKDAWPGLRETQFTFGDSSDLTLPNLKLNYIYTLKVLPLCPGHMGYFIADISTHVDRKYNCEETYEIIMINSYIFAGSPLQR